MNTHFDIVAMIERNPLTRLTKDYQSRLVNKIQTRFTAHQQQIFAASFYCYLNYDPSKDYVINFDDVWKWAGFARKDNAKRILLRHFVQDIDYKIFTPKIRDAPPIGGGEKIVIPAEISAALEGGVANKEAILITVKTFKKFCIKSNTSKADEIHDYYIQLEEILHETIDEESTELRKQLSVTKEQLDITKKQLHNVSHKLNITEEHMAIQTDEMRKLRTSYKQIAKNRTAYKFEVGKCVYIIKDIQRAEHYYKFGMTNNINKRLTSYRTSIPETKLLFLVFTDDNRLIEAMLKATYEDNLYVKNHEYIVGVKLEEIINCILSHIKYMNLKCSVVSDIEKYNEKLLVEDSTESVDSRESDDMYTKIAEVSSKIPNNNEEEVMINITTPNKASTASTKRNFSYRSKINKLCTSCHTYVNETKFFRLSRSPCILHDTCIQCYSATNGASKQCTKCDTIQPLTNFHTDKHKADGTVSQCRMCVHKEHKKKVEEQKKNILLRGCNVCKGQLPWSSFYKFIDKDGHQSLDDTCKSCHDTLKGKSLQCFMCKQIKSVIDFNKCASNKSGYKTWCRPCESAKRKAQRDAIIQARKAT